MTIQIGIRLDEKSAQSLQSMAEDSGQKVTTVARNLLVAAIEQAERGEARPMPPYLRRFYGEASPEEQEPEE